MTQEKREQLRGFIDQYHVELEGFEAELKRTPFGAPGSSYAQVREKFEERADRRRQWIAELEARIVA